MKIGLVRRGYSASGGAEQYLKRFARALLEAGHAPVLFASPEWPEQEWTVGPMIRVAGNSPASFANQLEKLEPRSRCEVLFSLERLNACDVFRAGDGVHRAWLDRRARFEPRWKSWLRERNPKHRQILELEKSLFLKGGAGRVIANSKLVAEEIQTCFGYPEERVSVIYNGLPASAFEPHPGARTALREGLGLGDDDCMILFAGSGWERKGLRFAVEAVQKLPASAHATLVVAGRGPASGFANPRTHFLGPVRNMAEWMAAADLFILPTLYDPFSNASLEAYAAGLPVITTTANGFSEVLDQGKTGSVVDAPDDVEALTQALLHWSDPDRREASRTPIREAARRFTIEANLEQTLEVLAGK